MNNRTDEEQEARHTSMDHTAVIYKKHIHKQPYWPSNRRLYTLFLTLCTKQKLQSPIN